MVTAGWFIFLDRHKARKSIIILLKIFLEILIIFQTKYLQLKYLVKKHAIESYNYRNKCICKLEKLYNI